MNTGVGFTFDHNTPDAVYNVTATTVTDNTSRFRKVAFEAAGDMIADTLDCGAASRRTIAVDARGSAANLPASVGEGLGRTVASTFDVLGRVKSLTHASGDPPAVTGTAAYVNTRYGMPDTVTDVLGDTTGCTCDGAGNVLTATDPLNRTATATCNSQGNTQDHHLTAAAHHHYRLRQGRLRQRGHGREPARSAPSWKINGRGHDPTWQRRYPLQGHAILVVIIVVVVSITDSSQAKAAAALLTAVAGVWAQLAQAPSRTPQRRPGHARR